MRKHIYWIYEVKSYSFGGIVVQGNISSGFTEICTRIVVFEINNSVHGVIYYCNDAPAALPDASFLAGPGRSKMGWKTDEDKISGRVKAHEMQKMLFSAGPI